MSVRRRREEKRDEGACARSGKSRRARLGARTRVSILADLQLLLGFAGVGRWRGEERAFRRKIAATPPGHRLRPFVCQIGPSQQQSAE